MFVTFEGPEGGGKSTLIRSVGLELRRRGHPVLETREPGAGDFGRRVRELLLESEAVVPEAELFLFLADRSNHVATVILPALQRGEWVLCDRFADSTVVYQSYVRGFDRAFVERCNTLATRGLKPDLTLLLDLPPEVGLSRITRKDRLDSEPLEFHKKVRAGFLELASEDPAQWRTIDASQPADVVLREALAHLP